MTFLIFFLLWAPIISLHCLKACSHNGFLINTSAVGWRIIKHRNCHINCGWKRKWEMLVSMCAGTCPGKMCSEQSQHTGHVLHSAATAAWALSITLRSFLQVPLVESRVIPVTAFSLNCGQMKVGLISKYVFVAPRKFSFTQAEMLAVSAAAESHTFWAQCELKETFRT